MCRNTIFFLLCEQILPPGLAGEAWVIAIRITYVAREGHASYLWGLFYTKIELLPDSIEFRYLDFTKNRRDLSGMGKMQY